MKTLLYLGTDPAPFESQGHFQGHLIHCPVIKILPRPVDHPEIGSAYAALAAYTHLIFTSKNAVQIFFQHLKELGKTEEILAHIQIVAVGKVTAAYLSLRRFPPHLIAEEETQEGLIALLKKLDLTQAYLFLPRSSLARPVLTQFFQEQQIRYHACDLYDTVTQVPSPLPDLTRVDEILFTSPSTVQAFMTIFGALPKDKKLLAIGPVTEQALREARGVVGLGFAR